MHPALMAMAFAHVAAGRYEAGLPWAERAHREGGGLPQLYLKLSLGVAILAGSKRQASA